jgi:hypothetical protein
MRALSIRSMGTERNSCVLKYKPEDFILLLVGIGEILIDKF